MDKELLDQVMQLNETESREIIKMIVQKYINALPSYIDGVTAREPFDKFLLRLAVDGSNKNPIR